MAHRKLATEFKIAAARLATEQGYTQKQAAAHAAYPPRLHRMARKAMSRKTCHCTR